MASGQTVWAPNIWRLLQMCVLNENLLLKLMPQQYSQFSYCWSTVVHASEPFQGFVSVSMGLFHVLDQWEKILSLQS